MARWRFQGQGSVLQLSHVTKEDVMVVQCNVSNPNHYIYRNAYLNVFGEWIYVLSLGFLFTNYKKFNDYFYLFQCDLVIFV